MASPVAEELLTAEQYALMANPPGMRTELVRGRVVTMPPAKTGHGRRGARIDRALSAFAIANDLGDTTGEGGYLLTRDPDTIRAPDAAFLSKERIPPAGIPDEDYIEGAPDLAVEVISPDDTESAVAEKVATYLAAGAQRVWEVRPRLKTVTVHRPDREPVTLGVDGTLRSEDAGFSVEGFTLAVAAVFAAAN